MPLAWDIGSVPRSIGRSARSVGRGISDSLWTAIFSTTIWKALRYSSIILTVGCPKDYSNTLVLAYWYPHCYHTGSSSRGLWGGKRGIQTFNRTHPSIHKTPSADKKKKVFFLSVPQKRFQNFLSFLSFPPFCFFGRRKSPRRNHTSSLHDRIGWISCTCRMLSIEPN